MVSLPLCPPYKLPLGGKISPAFKLGCKDLMTMQRCLPCFLAEWRHPSFPVKLWPSLLSASCFCSDDAVAWCLHLYRCRCSFAPYASQVCMPPFIHTSYPFQQPGLFRQHRFLVCISVDGFASGLLQVFQVQVAFCTCGLDWIGCCLCAPTSWLQCPHSWPKECSANFRMSCRSIS